jgi:tetratricopeptide (TPR) repeat protein
MSTHSTSRGDRKPIVNVILVIGLILVVSGCSSVSVSVERLLNPLQGGTEIVTPSDEVAPKSSQLATVTSSRRVSARTGVIFQQATEALESEDYELAETLLLEFIELEPEFSSPYTNLGILYLKTSRAEAALTLFRKAIELKPDDCIPLVQIGIVERQRRSFELAEKSYLACIANDPNYATAYLNLGILYELYQGRLPDALSAYQTYLTLAPSKQVASWVIDLSRRVEIEGRLADRGQLR